jgi:hypothetical protein
MVRRLVLQAAVVELGAVAAAGLFWGLVNIPESNALALTASTTLALLLPLVVAIVLGLAIALGSGRTGREALSFANRGVRGFAAGLLVLAVLWWLTSSLDAWWLKHTGEVDALFLRYGGTAKTAWLHTGMRWLLWLACWAPGLAAIVGATGATARRTSLLAGLGRVASVRGLGGPLVAILALRALWTLVYWRPAGLPDDSAELAFTAVKLMLLFEVASAVTVASLQVSDAAD